MRCSPEEPYALHRSRSAEAVSGQHASPVAVGTIHLFDAAAVKTTKACSGLAFVVMLLRTAALAASRPVCSVTYCLELTAPGRRAECVAYTAPGALDRENDRPRVLS
jgi:hypothetical protein